MNRALRWGLALTLALAAAGAPGTVYTARGDDGPTPPATDAGLRSLLERYAPAVVAVKAVVKVELQMGGQGRDQEQTFEMLGVVVDPSGLVMISNAQISSSRLSEMMTSLGMVEEGFQFTMTPTEFKVYFEGVDQGRPAFLAAADTQLDLAFLQLEDPGPTPLPAVDFTTAAEPTLGQEVVGLARLNSSFDHAAYYEVARVSGEVRKPRRAWILDGQLTTLGLAVFNAAGKPVGVISTVVSSVAPDTAGNGGGLSGIIASLGPRKTVGPVGVFMLPATPVAKAIELSKVRAAKLLEERREAGGKSDQASPAPAAGGAAPGGR
jgi:hypothetical protein